MGMYRGSSTSERSYTRACALVDRYHASHCLESFSLENALISYLTPFVNCCTGLYWDVVLGFPRNDCVEAD